MSDTYLTPLEYLYQWEAQRPHDIYLRQPRQRQWQEYSWQRVADESRRMAQALAHLGIAKGDRVAIISKNCAEWIMADLAIMMNGAIGVPLYPTQSDDSIQYVLNHCGCKLAFVGKLDNPKHMQQVIPEDIIQLGFNYDGIQAPYMWNDLIAQHEAKPAPYHPNLDDIYTIIYTSGTTGHPKGVVNNYRSASFAATQGIKTFNVDQHEHAVSFLPLAHVAERIALELPSLFAGFKVSFVESLDTFAEDLRLIQPTRFFAVPRLWTKFQMGILEKLPQKKLDTLLRIPLINRISKKKIRQGLGLDKCTMFISGAAPLSVSVLKWYERLGIHIQEAYGMSENWAYVCINRRESIRFGTVGKIFDQCEVKISELGEVLIKSPATMQGYYLDEAKTQEVIKDEFYHTGDKGQLSDDGYLTITGRIKDTFKTGKGEFINPSYLESMLAENTNIEQLCVTGLGLPQPLALVVLSEQAKDKDKQQVSQELEHTLNKVNQNVKSHEALNAVIVVKDEWLPENGLMTPTLKVKRSEVAQRYEKITNEYADAKAVVWE